MPRFARRLAQLLILAACLLGVARLGSGQAGRRPQYHSSFPVASPDGRHILFSRDSSGQTLRFVMNADGSNMRPVSGRFMAASWFPDGKRLFGGIPGETRRDPIRLASANLDGSDFKEIPTGGALIRGGGGGTLLGDGKTFLFVNAARDSAGRLSMELDLLNIDDARVRRVPFPPMPGRVVPPIAAAPDGRRLAFTIADTTDPTSYARSTTLYVMNIDGTEGREIAAVPDLMEQPSWSPDGRRIVAVQAGRTPPIGTPMPPDHVPNANLVIVELETGVIRPISHRGRRYLDEVPSWSANGYIYFQSNRDGSMEIYRMKPDGSAQERITSPPRTN